jgi:hypothetical protein
MSAASVSQAASDPELRARVLAMAHKELMADPLKEASTFGISLAAGSVDVTPLMFPVAVDTEAAYEAALQAGRGAPGHDMDIITDAALTSAINAHWPWQEGEGPQ